MRASTILKERGYGVTLRRGPYRELGDGDPDMVLASAIFSYSKPVVDIAISQFPGIVVGGTGTGLTHSIDDVLDIPEGTKLDYSHYPDYRHSIGFSQRDVG